MIFVHYSNKNKLCVHIDMVVIVSARVHPSLELRFCELIIILYTTANRVTMRGITKTVTKVNYAVAQLTQTQASLRACQVQKGYKHRVLPIHFLSFFVLLFCTYQIHPASGRTTLFSQYIEACVRQHACPSRWRQPLGHAHCILRGLTSAALQ